MTGPVRRFDPSELRVAGEPDLSTAEQADALLAARELESVASAAVVRPSDGFEDRVMAAVAAEPAPRLVVRPRSAVRGGIIGSFLATVRDSWGVATTGGRPAAVRAQAFAFVLLVAVATTAVAGVGAAGVGALFQRDGNPTPSVQPIPTESAMPSATPSPSVEPSASPSPSATETAEPTRTPRPTATDDARTPRPTRTPEGTDDHGGGGGGGGGSGSDGSGGGSGPGGGSDDPSGGSGSGG